MKTRMVLCDSCHNRGREIDVRLKNPVCFCLTCRPKGHPYEESQHSIYANERFGDSNGFFGLRRVRERTRHPLYRKDSRAKD